MNISQEIQIFVVLFIFLEISYSQNEIKYESIKNICEKCTCLRAEDTQFLPHYVLSCSTKNFQHILPSWPDEFGTNHTGAQIVVTFSGNKISMLQQLPETDGIVSFSCRHCGIVEIASAAFMDVVNILRLDLSWNDLTGDVLRPDVFRGRYSNREYAPIGLEELDISHNRIFTLDRRIFEHTPHLKILNLGDNKFDLIDITTLHAIQSAINLENLDLSNNALAILPDGLFEHAAKLKELHLEGNKFMIIPETLGILSKSLQSLYIGANPIELINDESFLGLTELKQLNISSMPNLNVVNLGTFTRMKKLEVLICNNNQKLIKFDLGSLKCAENLRVLDLSNNSLEKLNVEYEFDNEPNITKRWHKLEILRLTSNPWYCDCFLMRTIEELKQHYRKYDGFYNDDNARCTTPYDLAGASLHNMKSDFLCQASMIVRQQLRIEIHEPESYLRHKSITLSIISICTVFAIGILVGLSFVLVRRKLRKNDFGFTTPIRYTTVRNSTISVE